MNPSDSATDELTPARFHSLRIVIVVLLVTMSVPFWTSWYSDEVSVPRYCDTQAETLANLEKVLRESRPAGEGSRIPYIRAAKLIFLLPRESEESLPDYLKRVEIHLQESC